MSSNEDGHREMPGDQIQGEFDMKRILTLSTIAILIALVSYAAMAQPDDNTPMRVEVAEDGARFIFGQERLFDDGNPNYGTPFVTQGYIYPEGTLNGSNGVLPDGSPEFPDLVLGEWTCYGYMIGEGAHTTTGVWVVSTQVYKFNDTDDIIVTSGFELVDFDVPLARAITGGTGEFSAVRGEQSQVLMGFTEQMGVNLSVEFQFE
jgi:hypothetical protein